MDLLDCLDACSLAAALTARKAEHPLAGISPAMYSARQAGLELSGYRLLNWKRFRAPF